jgi:hypothetical protein
MNKIVNLGLILAGLALAACGGGSGSTALPVAAPATVVGTSSSQQQTAFTITNGGVSGAPATVANGSTTIFIPNVADYTTNCPLAPNNHFTVISLNMNGQVIAPGTYACPSGQSFNIQTFWQTVPTPAPLPS